nr:La domain family protein [Colletotrichum truncatum]KAF6792423.1 La domain family protein [Colletotrichum truncatum]
MRVTETHIDDVPYPEFRTRALSKRRDALARNAEGVPRAIPGEMISLYRFWSHFLARHFDLEMFEEFRAYAVADTTGKMGSTVGLENLIAYYETILEAGDNYSHWPLNNLEFLYGEAKKLAASAGAL